jgi:hypothetical protein
MSNRSFPNGWQNSSNNQRPLVEKPTDSEIIELAWCDETTFDSIKSALSQRLALYN